MKEIPVYTAKEEMHEFLQMPDGIKKNIKYHNGINTRGFINANILVKDCGTVHFSHSIGKIKKGEKYYVKYNTENGFTVKPNGEMSIWFNKQIQSITFINDIISKLGIDWLDLKFMPFITKSVMGKVIARKITNPIDLSIAILKTNKVSASHSKFRNAVMSCNMSKADFLMGIKVAKDINHFFDFFTNMKEIYDRQNLYDLINQAIILEEKINFLWSEKRMNSEHERFTSIIMDYEAEDLSEEPLEFLQPIKNIVPEGFELIDNQKELYKEGSMMKHCVYTNYWSMVVSKSYVVLKTSYEGKNYTIGLNVRNHYGDNFKLNQVYGKRNTPAPDAVISKVKDLVSNLNNEIDNLTDQSVDEAEKIFREHGNHPF